MCNLASVSWMAIDAIGPLILLISNLSLVGLSILLIIKKDFPQGRFTQCLIYALISATLTGIYLTLFVADIVPNKPHNGILNLGEKLQHSLFFTAMNYGIAIVNAALGIIGHLWHRRGNGKAGKRETAGNGVRETGSGDKKEKTLLK